MDSSGLFALLGALLRRSMVATVSVYTALVYAARFVGEDRFESTSYYAAGAIVALLLLQRVWPWAVGLLAVAVATPGLWGRVPVYTTAVDEQLCFLLPGAAITALAGLAVRDGLLRRHRWLPGLGLLLAALGVGGAAMHTVGINNTASSDKPNVLFVLVDTLRQDHVQPYGEATPTPGITRLSEEGTRYADAITVIPKTTQSVAAFQTESTRSPTACESSKTNWVPTNKRSPKP